MVDSLNSKVQQLEQQVYLLTSEKLALENSMKTVQEELVEQKEKEEEQMATIEQLRDEVEQLSLKLTELEAENNILKLNNQELMESNLQLQELNQYNQQFAELSEENAKEIEYWKKIAKKREIEIQTMKLNEENMVVQANTSQPSLLDMGGHNEQSVDSKRSNQNQLTLFDQLRESEGMQHTVNFSPVELDHSLMKRVNQALINSQSPVQSPSQKVSEFKLNLFPIELNISQDNKPDADLAEIESSHNELNTAKSLIRKKKKKKKKSLEEWRRSGG